jgi:gluconolactonase
VWSSSGDGVHCYNPDGQLLGKIRLPKKASNLVFGGADRRRMFITCSDAMYSITLNAQGCVKL